jgi:hypothetical protein
MQRVPAPKEHGIGARVQQERDVHGAAEAVKRDDRKRRGAGGVNARAAAVREGDSARR